MSKDFCVLILYLIITQILAQTPPKVPYISPNNKIISISTKPPNWDELGTALKVLKDMPKSKTEKLISLINLLKVISTKQTEDSVKKSLTIAHSISEIDTRNVTVNRNNSAIVSKINKVLTKTRLPKKKAQTNVKQYNQNAETQVPMLIPIFKAGRKQFDRNKVSRKKSERADLVRESMEHPTQNIPIKQYVRRNEIDNNKEIKSNMKQIAPTNTAARSAHVFMNINQVTPVPIEQYEQRIENKNKEINSYMKQIAPTNTAARSQPVFMNKNQVTPVPIEQYEQRIENKNKEINSYMKQIAQNNISRPVFMNQNFITPVTKPRNGIPKAERNDGVKPDSPGALNLVDTAENHATVIRSQRLAPQLILAGSVTRTPIVEQPNHFPKYIQRQMIPIKAVETVPLNYQVVPTIKSATTGASLTDIYKVLTNLFRNIPKMATNSVQKSQYQSALPQVLNNNRNNMLINLRNAKIANAWKPPLVRNGKDVIVFKPKTISFFSCYNNLLRQITMKILVPLYVTKLIQ